jgi:2'-deoxynucleoside 5'-phosphate N-hydrolase
MRAYIAVSFAKHITMQPILDLLKETVLAVGIIPFVFVEQYRFEPEQEKQMMTKALSEIGQSDILIAEVSDKAIGIGVEAGFAKAIHKILVYLRRAGSEHSTTVAGISDYSIVYTDTADLRKKLEAVLNQITFKAAN